MASLLDRSLDDLARQDRPRPRTNGARGSGRGMSRTTTGGRGSPYNKATARADPDSSWQHDLFQTNKLNYGGEEKTSSKRRADDNEPRSTRLKITNLHYEVSERELETLFAQIGNLAPGTSRESNPAVKESEADAVRAKEAFHNALAKGERISIEYDFSAPRRAKRDHDGLNWNSMPTGDLMKVSPGGNSLLARMENSRELQKTQEPQFLSSIGRAAGQNDIRDSSSRVSTQRGSGGARGSADRGRGSARSRGGGSGRDRGKASGTAEDLDKELDDFMSKGSGESATIATSEDVEMS